MAERPIGPPSDSREVRIDLTLVWDADKGWCYKHLHMTNSGFLFDTEAERDELTDAFVHGVRYACGGIFTHAQSIEIRDNAIALAKVATEPHRLRRATELLLIEEAEHGPTPDALTVFE